MQKASSKHKVEVEEISLNLNSMMDLFAVLIPALLMMSAVVEVCALTVVAPSVGAADAPPPSDKPPFNLTVAIGEQGYVLTGSGAAPVGGAPGTPMSVPLVQRKVSCSRWRNSWPPPRSRNRAEPACTHADDKREFWVYDTQALAKKMVEVKDGFPDERRIVIQAEPNVEYESVIDVMDATRDIREPGSEARILFDEVVLSPA
jgi:biopolymer transport protein TolR